MTVWTSVFWKILIQLAKKWPKMALQRQFINSLSFPNTLYHNGILIRKEFRPEKPEGILCFLTCSRLKIFTKSFLFTLLSKNLNSLWQYCCCFLIKMWLSENYNPANQKNIALVHCDKNLKSLYWRKGP